ncbi:RicAFT regulatory complex protein RicA family protein [Caldalkalibacillus salinus]|uniref:RicAFT regulatory complex protein RicA family protein n=1 Tax=Caldalkalibacillus salinus TaxID=2803787 RepID=UPI0019245745|nr:YlbF family regulator [Caldalkalibacillus salinus]
MSETVSRKEIIDQAEKLAKLIAQSKEVEFFKQAEQQIKKNQKVQNLINAIKFKQKQAVHAEHYDKNKALQDFEKSLDELNRELDEIPVVQEFKQSQVEVNDLLQMMTNIISNKVTDEIILSTGGDPLSGQTGGDNPITCTVPPNK